MITKLNIKDAYIAKFTHITNYNVFIDEFSTVHRNCIINSEKGDAIDIETGDVYHIIERDGNGIMTLDQANKVLLRTPYVLGVQDIKWDKMDIATKRAIYVHAIMTRIKYYKKEKYKVKELERKDSKIK